MILPRHFSSRTAPVLALAFGVAMLAGCATTPDRAPSAQTGGAPSAAPRDDSPILSTVRSVTVLEDAGHGPQLCVGIILTSLPEQCGGPDLIGWDWADWEGHYDTFNETRSGSFTVQGRYDPEAFTFTPTEVIPLRDAVQPHEAPHVPSGTPCPAPAGGWQVRDAEHADDDAMMTAITHAEKIPGYAGVWVDDSLVGMTPENVRRMEQGLDPVDTHPELTIVNVRVTGDPAAAEAELRELWGGPLCVTPAEHSEAELRRIMDEIMTDLESDPGRLSFGTDPVAGRVDIEVTYDDGTLQERYDAKYGIGLVRVQSVLQPVD